MVGHQRQSGIQQLAILGLMLGLILTGVSLQPRVRADLILYVDAANTSGPWNGTIDHPFQTIGDAAAIPESTTIYVAAGTYAENVVITHSLRLVGASSLTTIIDGSGSGHTLSATGTEDTPISLTLTGFTLQNAGQHGFANLAGSFLTGGTIQGNSFLNSQEGDDIQLDHCTNLTIQNNVIAHAHVSGISFILSSACTLGSNTIQYNQKGISLSYSGTILLTDNTIDHNTIYGAYLQQSSQNSFSRNHFSLNGQQVSDPCQNTYSVDQQGNYWDDYNGYDNNSDGIGDRPYLVDGSNSDAYPLGIFKQTSQGGDQNTAPLVTSLTVTPNHAFTGDLISFNGEGYDADGIVSAYKWESNIDGHLSSAKTFTSSKLSPGNHTISFSVQDDDGAWSQPQTTTLTITSAPYAVIDNITPATAMQYQPITFYGHAVNAGTQDIQYRWTSSINGFLSSALAFTATNLSCGTHTISLEIRVIGQDWSEPATQELVVQQTASENGTIIANAGGPYTGIVKHSITFDASKTTAPLGANLSYTWDFGDGTTGSGITVSHTYTASGTYSLRLTVTDHVRGSSSSSTSVTVSTSSSGSSTLGEGSLAGSLLTMPSFPYIALGVVFAISAIVIFMVWRRRG